MTIDFYILQFDGECLQIILSFYRFQKKGKVLGGLRLRDILDLIQEA